MRLLIFLPLIASASVQFQPIPLLEAKGDDMQVTLPARKAIEEMTEGFQVTAVIEVDTRTSLATLLWRHLSATHAKPFDMFSAPLWFIFTPPLPGNTKPHALLVAPLWDCAHASNSTRVAINIMASLSQHILINIPQDSVSQLCVPALQALIAESDLTHRNAHKPTGNENERFTTDAQVNEDWFTFLPRLQVIVSGGWITRDIDSLLRMDGAAPFKSVEAIAVPFFESADFSFQTSDIGRWPEVVEKLDIVANNVGADAADWPKFLWLHSGQRFLVWLDHVKDAVAPRLNLSSSFASFATKLRTLALDRAVGRYVYEMNGAIKYGWIINKDGSTTRAIAPPSAESDVEQSEEQSALVNTDVNLGKYKLRPPPASDLRRLHDGASARGEQFIRVLLNGITDEDAAVVELNGQLEQRYKVLEGTNTDNIKRFVKECEEELKQVCEQRITRLSSTLPVPKKQIDETVQRVLDDCTKDLTVVAGYLEGEVFERAKAAMVLGLTKAGEKQNRVNGQMVRKQLEECIQKALDEGSLKHLQSLLPLGRQEMAELVETAEKKATETWDAETVQVFKGSAVWPERFDDVKNYMVELDRLLQKQKKDLEGENRVAVQEKCKVKVDELIHDFRKSVVKGQTLPYPGPESIIFDRAALEATSYVATYATSLSEFSDIPSFSDEKRRLEEALQAKRHVIASQKWSENRVGNILVAVVCTVPWAESARHLVVLSDGNHQDVWAKYCNVTPPTVSCKTVAPGQPTTQVCLFQVRAAYVHATTWETAMKAGQSVRIMATKAAEAEGLRMDWLSVFTKVHRRQGVCEVSVRVPVEDVPKLLRSSGKAGTFWKAMSFVNGTDTLPAVWVSDCALEEARQIAARTPNTFGVIGGANTGVFGIRTTPEHVAATESAVGKKKLSKRQRRGDKYIVTTACPAEHPSDLLAACAAAEWKVEPVGSFKRRGDTGPPAPVLYRLDRASISIRKYNRSIDARRRKGFAAQCQRVKINLPREFLASLQERPEPVPGQKRSRASDETTTQDKVARVDTADNMATDCRHANWQESYENDKAFLCENVLLLCGIVVDVICLQETKLTSTGQKKIRMALKECAALDVWQPFFGSCCEGRKCGNDVPSQITGGCAGVAILVRKGLPACLVSPFDVVEERAYEAARFLHVRVATGSGKGALHVVSLYGHCGHSARMEREKLVEGVLWGMRRRLGASRNTPCPRGLEDSRRVHFLWLRISRAAEDYLLQKSKIEGNLAAYRGRGERRRLSTQRVSARPSPEGAGADTAPLKRARCLLGRMREYSAARAKWEDMSSAPCPLSLQLKGQWDKIRLFQSFILQRTDGKCALPLVPPSAKAARGLSHTISDVCQSLAQTTLNSRYLEIARCQRELRNPLGKESFAWVKKEAPPTFYFTNGRDGRLTANLAEVDARVRRKWDPVLRICSRMPGRRNPRSPFLREYGDFIAQHPCQLGPITADRLLSVARKKRVQSSCGVDGWRMREVAALPDTILEGFAAVLNEVEETGLWPDGVLDALVTLIPKGEGDDPLKLRPITVSSVVYRLWASVRLQEVLVWQEQWIHESQHGFRKGHSCDDVIMDIALSIEESLINGTPLHGIALDFAKCFDRVPQGLVLDLVEALGLHERVLAPLRHVYKYLRRRFKYPLGVGDEFKVTNGILQGCPISVVLINALLSVLSKALVSRARVSPKSFADDLYLLSRLAKLLQEGIEVTAIFGSLTGLALNEGKCASFSTSEKGPRLEVGGKAVKSVKTVKVLGVPLGTEGPVDNGRSDATVEAAARLEASPLKPRTKFRVMQTIAASAHYGAAYCANSAGGFANNSVLRTALSACLIPRSNRAKSPLATLTLVAKAHLCDPACASGYSSLRTAAKQYQKERFRLRMDALLVSGADASLKGPVGLISNLLREIRFLPAKRHSFELLSFEGATVPFSGKETLHFVREGLRLRAWRYLTTQRQGYSGIERGVDVRLLNRLWQNRATEDRLSFAIRKCIAGAVYSREWCNRKWGTGDGVCEFCDGVAAQNMPLCLSTRGIPPIGTPPVLVERVQKLIGTISIEMAQAQRNIATTRPWELASAAAGRYDVELARDSRELLTKQIGTRFAATL
ncbi:Retrovirus-related Pol polyprotein from type-2 retrotransposable element R2DM, partial [Diplonema papillatum]